MKTLVIGLDCAAPEILFSDDQLVNLRRLMEMGCYGGLESVVPPITVPAWMCMATSSDPGTLGVYGFRNRVDHSYDRMQIVDSKSIKRLAVWDQVACEGGVAHILGVPPNFPPRRTSGVSVGCFLTPDTKTSQYTHPPQFADTIRDLTGEYPVDVVDFRNVDRRNLAQQIYDMTAKHFEVIRHIMRHETWDYLQFVEIGLDRIQHAFWKHHDPEHRDHDPESPYGNVIRDYYRYLDQEIGSLLELLDEETNILVLSDHGAQRLDGGVCINEWLLQEGLLAIENYPEQPTRLEQLDVDWTRTQAWGEGGYYARIFLNVRGREPQGTIDPRDYEQVRDQLKTRIEAIPNDQGQPMATRVVKPEEAFREVRNVAPDLIVHFDDLRWRSVGSVGHRAVHVQENDTGPDDCNHAQVGAFILAGSQLPLQGEAQGAHLLDMAPTLLQLGGYEIPETMQGSSLIDRTHPGWSAPDQQFQDADDLVKERLQGLGYI